MSTEPFTTKGVWFWMLSRYCQTNDSLFQSNERKFWLRQTLGVVRLMEEMHFSRDVPDMIISNWFHGSRCVCVCVLLGSKVILTGTDFNVDLTDKAKRWALTKLSIQAERVWKTIGDICLTTTTTNNNKTMHLRHSNWRWRFWHVGSLSSNRTPSLTKKK